MALPSSLPRFVQPDIFRQNPLECLRQAAAPGSKIVVISEMASLFSRTTRCSGVVAVFGADAVREVLSQPRIFGKGRSVGQRLALPSRLLNLNSGLFSMRGTRHAHHRKLLLAALSQRQPKDFESAIGEALRIFLDELQRNSTIPLFTTMRRLTLLVSERLVFGACGQDSPSIGELIRGYFDARRALAMRSEQHGEGRGRLIELGDHTDAAIRARLSALIAAHRNDPAPDPLIVRLARAAAEQGTKLSSDELVMHANMLFMAGSEPIATALTWIFLLLSQQPAMRHALRVELAQSAASSTASPPAGSPDFRLMDAVIHESLRLFPPNAVMVRLAGRAGVVQGTPIPQNCEIVVSPFVSHREADIYPAPDDFDPGRWQSLRPSPYQYFPYGAGGHFCLGRQLAHQIMCRAMERLLAKFDLILAEDQSIDWKVDVTFKPSVEPMIRIFPLLAQSAPPRGGRLLGPVADLVRFSVV